VSVPLKGDDAVRKISYGMSVSLDGFMEGPDRDISWHRVDAELHQHFNDRLSTASMFLSGRVTHQLMADFWPTADQDPDCPPTMAEFAGIWRDKPKIVFSHTLTEAGWHTTIMRDVVVDEIMALKDQPGGELSLGGAELAATFRQLDLIDEYLVYVHPVLIGQGKPMFLPGAGMANLRLVDTHTFGNGVVLLHHARS
jgi:dihydrofolate reductase